LYCGRVVFRKVRRPGKKKPARTEDPAGFF